MKEKFPYMKGNFLFEKKTYLSKERFLVKGNFLTKRRLSKRPTSYNGSDKGKEDVLLVADADLLVVHLHQEGIFKIQIKQLFRVELDWESIA